MNVINVVNNYKKAKTVILSLASFKVNKTKTKKCNVS